jgi:hypothetical protein
LQKNGLQAGIDSSFTDMEQSANNISSKDTFDMWSDVKTRLVYKVRLADQSDNPALNYVDLGLNYQKSGSYPFFINVKSKDGESADTASLVTTLDSKQNSLTMKFSLVGGGDVYKGNVEGNFTFKPTNDAAQITAPVGATPLSDVLSSLGLGSLLDSSSPILAGRNEAATDSKRKLDLEMIQTQLEASYNETGSYPSLTQLNSDAWRKTNMKSLDETALQDPDGSSKTLAAAPGAKVYAYVPTNAAGASCEASPTSCQKYTLTATLSTGTAFTKTNLE